VPRKRALGCAPAVSAAETRPGSAFLGVPIGVGGREGDQRTRPARTGESRDVPGPRVKPVRFQIQNLKKTEASESEGPSRDFAREPLRVPQEANPAAQVIGDHLFHHARAKALVRGWSDGGAVCFGPTQRDTSVCRARPLHLNVTIGYRQSPVLGRVGG